MPSKQVLSGVALFACLSISSGVRAAETSQSAQTVPSAPATTTAPTTAGQAAIDGGVPSYIKAETAEERRLRVGPVDPGVNPDEKTLFYRLSRAFHIAKFEKKWAAFDQPAGFVRPYAGTPFVYELYQQNDNWVWVWIEEPGQQQPTASGTSGSTPPLYTPEQLQYLKRMLPEFAALDVPDAQVVVQFEESSAGLPTTGSWRNSLTVADMNGDGNLDIVAPPQRGGDGIPSIFLGDGKGHWRPWNEAVWPYRLDYGSVVAADFNKDGHMDLAFAVHLFGVRVFLGDGKGHFRDSSHGLPVNDWGSRRIVVGDFNHDGYPDLAAISEGPRPNQTSALPGGNIRLFLNQKHGAEWKSVDIADGSHSVSGDYLAIGNFNGDRTPDVVSANIHFGSTDNIFLSQKNQLKWESVPQDGSVVPSMSYYFAVAAGHLSSKKFDDAVLSYVRSFPEDAESLVAKPQLSKVAGLDRISFASGKPVRSPIMRYAGERPISGMALGDFDGDGNLDIIFSRFEPARDCVILLGDGKGGFKRAAIEGLQVQSLANYDIKVADVNGDGRPDVILSYESGSDTKLGQQDGSIRVFLNRGSRPRKDSANAQKKPGL